MSAPRISFIIPNYNHARFLPRCLNAVLSQKVPPDEIIVVDDGSTDDSREVLAAFAAKSPRIRPLHNERNLGIAATCNRALAAATGDYVSLLAADDQVLPDLIESCLPLLIQHPGAGAASGLCEWRCADTGLVWYQGTRMPQEACYLNPQEMVRLCRSGRFSMAGQHAVFKRSAVLEAGGMIQDLRWFMDVFSSWVIGFRHGVCHVPKVLSVFNSSKTSYYHSAKGAEERGLVLGRFLSLIGSEPFRDVAPTIRASGLVGGLGGFAVRVVLSDRKYWPYVNASFLTQAARRSAQVMGRRFLPQPVARLAARMLYGLKKP